ncbi:MAG: 30S ribosomal protein S20 [Dehalococcoidia bacterium]|nr:30S ribosomal protein S20 [Dehalococcoidia bacterium]
MAHSNQAKKRVRQNIKVEEQNRSIKSRLSTLIKSAFDAIDNKDDNANNIVRSAQSYIDRAAKKNIIHKNKASRTKARIDKYQKRTED